MDALVPARPSRTPSAVTGSSAPSWVGAPSATGALVPQLPSAEHRRMPVTFHEPRWSGSARQLARRKPSRRQDEHPP
jgi:hypothetical protein